MEYIGFGVLLTLQLVTLITLFKRSTPIEARPTVIPSNPALITHHPLASHEAINGSRNLD